MSDRYTPPSSPEEVADLLSADLGYQEFVTPGGEDAIRMEGTAWSVMQAVAKGEERGAKANGYKRVVVKAKECFPDSVEEQGSYFGTGANAARCLQSSIDTVAEYGKHLFGQHLSRYEWLWMIRRIPLRHVWLPEGARSTRELMCTLALSRNETRGEFPPEGIVDLTDHHGVQLAYLLGFTTALAQLRMAYRWVCKDGWVEIDFGQKTINVQGPEGLRDRLKKYDKRVYESGGWGGLGIPIAEPDEVRIGENEFGPDDLIAVVPLREGQWSGNEEDANFARYMEAVVSLEYLFKLMQFPATPNIATQKDEIIPLAILLRSFAHLVKGEDLHIKSVRTVGYSVHQGNPTSHDSIRNGLQDGIDWANEKFGGDWVPDSTSDVLDRLRSLEGSVSPISPGRVLFDIRRGFVADWAAAHGRLLSALRFSAEDGEFANVRGPAFEEWMQKKLQSSNCPPAPWLNELVNRELRFDGESVGEFDAALSIPDSSLHYLIDCKSYLYTEKYEVGEHSTVRNIDQRLAEAASGMLDLCAHLHEHRDGDNYTIPEEAALIPLVVTPRLLYTSSPIGWQKYPDEEWGLYVVSSGIEVMRFTSYF